MATSPSFTSSLSSYVSSNSLDSEEEENKGEVAVSQLMLNRRMNRLFPMVKPKGLALPISILSSDNKHTDDLAHILP